ncbi:MAG: ACT domain-containing protein [Deltaproteobacteria bacterium]|nr:ACT domain-containing protein [Deltaproteobacteria bacterium]
MVEGGACLASSFRPGNHRLGSAISAPLARQKINLTLLTHVVGDEILDSVTVLCTDRGAAADSYSLLKARIRKGAVRPYPGACILSLYPHDKRSDIKGNFIRSLAQAKVMIRALASSPSAICAVLSQAAKNRALEVLFEHFEFPSYRTPAEFHAVVHPPQEFVREVIASYQEKIIRVYYIVHQAGLDLWDLSVPSSQALEDFAQALIALGKPNRAIPFLAAVPGPGKKFTLSFSLSTDCGDEVQDILKLHIPAIAIRRHSPVAAVFLHGPHFGDRFGIADTLVQALDRAKVSLLALSCAVSSITAMVREEELLKALQVLGKTFEEQS